MKSWIVSSLYFVFVVNDKKNNKKNWLFVFLSVYSFQYTSMKTVGVKAVDDTFKVSLHEGVSEK